MKVMGHSLMDLPTDKNLHLHFKDNKEALNGGVCCLSLNSRLETESERTATINKIPRIQK